MTSRKAAFQIAKYSWSNGDSGKASYRHLKGDNLHFVLRGDADAHGQLSLQIIQGTAVLNEIDLAKHIDIANSTRETFRRVNRHVADKQLPTYAVTSGVKLAITHRDEGDQVNRMQVAMMRAEDCDAIVSALRYRGMVFVAASQQIHGRPATSNSDLHSVASHFSHRVEPVSSIANTLDRIARGHNSQPSGVRHGVQATSMSNRSQGVSPPVFLPPGSRRHSTFTTPPPMASPGPFLKRDEHNAPRTPHVDHPLAAQVFPRVSSIYASTLGVRPHDTFEPSLWTRPKSVEDLLPPEIELPFDRVRQARSRSSSVLSFPALPKPQTKSGTSDSQDISNERTVIKPIDNHIAEMLQCSSNVKVSNDQPSTKLQAPFSQAMNHNRLIVRLPVHSMSRSLSNKEANILSFNASESTPKGQLQPRRRQASVAPSTPNVTTRSKRKLADSETDNMLRQTTQFKELDHLDRHSPGRRGTRTRQIEQYTATDVPSRANGTTRGLIENKMLPPPLVLSSASRSSPKDMNELLFGKRPKIAGDSKVIDARVGPSVTNAGPSTSATSTSDLMSASDKVVVDSEIVSLTTYNTLDISERHSVLNKFMLEMIGNADFATLCRDMSTCWQSLALGS